MRLADYLEQNQETILSEWEAFAATMLPAAADMTALSLRDHAPEILDAIASDLRTPQTAREQVEKSKGQAPVVDDAPETAAQTHAVLRARSGFDVKQLVAEYRALRASVLRLWLDAAPPDPNAFDDMLRFNEAIDQAVAESIAHFQREVEQARNLLLGVLGHDMRSPLNTVLTTASYLAALNAGDTVSSAADKLIRSGASLKSLLDDLVDFSRTRLGLGLKIEPAEIDLAEVLINELDQLRGAHPERTIELTLDGNALGHWDGARVQQLLRNLVSNALQYGTASHPVLVGLRGDTTHVHLAVTNHGRTIDPKTREEMFNPLRRGSDQGDGLGLGLFIVWAITEAHGGDVSVSSEDGETVFTVRLPRSIRT